VVAYKVDARNDPNVDAVYMTREGRI